MPSENGGTVTLSQKREQEYFDALRTITKFQPSEWFEDHAEKKYGLSPREALEAAYDNMQQVARDAILGRVRPKVPGERSLDVQRTR